MAIDLRPASASETGRLRRAAVLVALSLTFGLVQLDATIVNVSLDAVRAELGGGVDMAQWLVDGYAVPFAALLLAAGAVGDTIGHRRTCVVGFVVFAAASVPAALAGDWGVLVGSRVAQGVGAALMLPASLALVGELYPERRRRARALGVWGGIATLGFVAGPLVGGVLVTTLGWPAIFWLNVPVAIVLAVVVAALAPADRPRSRRIDVAGTVTGALALAALVAAVIEAGQQRTLPAVLLVGASAGLAVAFVLVERAAAEPLVPPRVVGSRALRNILATGFGFNFAMYGSLLCVSLVLQSAYGLSPLATGLAVLPMAVVVSVGATCSGFIAAVTGPRVPMIAGLVAGAVGTVTLGLGGLADGSAVAVVGLAVCGLVSFAMPAMTAVALDAVPAEHSGLAGGALNAVRQVGGALGVAVMGSMIGAAGPTTGLLVAGLVATLTLVGAMVGAWRATREVGP